MTCVGLDGTCFRASWLFSTTNTMSTTPSTSPPRTPDDNRAASSTRSTPSSDESCLDVSFNYVVDEDGNLVRFSKGSSRSDGSSPPTPSDLHLPESPALSKPVATGHLVSPVTRASLSRSESAFPVLSNANMDHPSHYTDRPARSFQRVASGPAPSYLAPTASSLAKPRTAARRVTLEDDRERVKSASSWSRQTLDPAAHPLQEEKENISESDDQPYLPTSSKQRSSPPLVTRSTSSAAPSRVAQARSAYLAGGSSSTNGRLADLPTHKRDPHARQIQPGLNRPGRVVKTATTTPASKYAASHLDGDASENDRPGERHSPTIILNDDNDTDPDEDLPNPLVSSSAAAPLSTIRQKSQGALNIGIPSLSLSTSRPRRSASLSDAARASNILCYQRMKGLPVSRP